MEFKVFEVWLLPTVPISILSQKLILQTTSDFLYVPTVSSLYSWHVLLLTLRRTHPITSPAVPLAKEKPNFSVSIPLETLLLNIHISFPHHTPLPPLDL